MSGPGVYDNDEDAGVKFAEYKAAAAGGAVLISAPTVLANGAAVFKMQPTARAMPRMKKALLPDVAAYGPLGT